MRLCTCSTDSPPGPTDHGRARSRSVTRPSLTLSAATAIAHQDANPRSKKAAWDNDVAPRTERRWRQESMAKGSPQYRYAKYLEQAQRPWRLMAYNRSRVMERTVEQLTRQELVDRIRELHTEAALQEGETNANRTRRGLRHIDRAADEERAAALKLELAACWRVAAERRITETEVFQGEVAS